MSDGRKNRKSGEGIDRRDFMKYVGAAGATFALSEIALPKARAVDAKKVGYDRQGPRPRLQRKDLHGRILGQFHETRPEHQVGRHRASGNRYAPDGQDEARGRHQRLDEVVQGGHRQDPGNVLLPG